MNKPEPFTEKLFRAIGAPMNPLCYETADQIYTVVWRAYFLGYSDVTIYLLSDEEGNYEF